MILPRETKSYILQCDTCNITERELAAKKMGVLHNSKDQQSMVNLFTL